MLANYLKYIVLRCCSAYVFGFYYARVVWAKFNYIGYHDIQNEFSYSGLFIFLFSFILIPRSWIGYLVDLFLFIPLVVYYFLTGVYFSEILYLLFFFFLLKIDFGSFDLRIFNYRQNFIYSLTIVSLFLLVILGANNLQLSAENHYITRYSSREIYSGMWAYFLNITQKALVPIALIWAIRAKKYILVTIILLLGTALFFITWQKSVIASYLLILIFTNMNKNLYNKSLLLYLIFPTILLAAYILDNLLFDAINTRVFYDGVYTRYCYGEYFNTPIYYSTSILRNVIVNDFSMAPSLLIGKEYFGPQVNANIGFPTDTIMNLGLFTFIGIIVNAVLINYYSKNLGRSDLGLVILTILFYNRISTEFWPFLITHAGVLWVFALSSKRKII